MPTPTAPGCIEVVLQAQQNGTERFNVMHFIGTSPHPTLAELTEAASTVKNSVVSHRPLWSSQVAFINVRATDRSQLAGPIVDVPFPTGTLGDNDSPPLPGNVACAVTLRTDTGGRSGHGRVFMFGLVAAQVLPNDTTTDAYRGAVNDYIGSIITNGALVDVFLGIFSRVHHAIYQVNTIVIDRNLDSQRRRLPGRGR